MRALHPVHHWLSLRVRLLCGLAFAIGTILPPYVPNEALAQHAEEEGPPSPQFLLVEDGFLMKSSSLTMQGSRRAYAEGIIHTVAAGENLQQIAQRYSISAETIRWANKLDEAAPVQPGDDLLILPVDGVVHTVAKGQTLAKIAEMYSVQPEAIARQNRLEGGYILAGQELIIPGGAPIVAKPTVVAQQPTTPDKKPPTKTTPSKTTLPPDEKVQPTSGTLQMPCNDCYYTQYYHPGHEAVDIQTKGGGPIFAAEDGIVIRADGREADGSVDYDQWNGGYGNVIEIDHGNGVVTLYGHNKELYVKEGDHVKRGQEIAFMGHTGRVYGATGIHTHFEVRVNGVKKNPLLYLQ